MDTPPDGKLSATIEACLKDALPTPREREEDPSGTENRRVEAVRRLLAFYRDPKVVHLGVREFFHKAWENIIAAADSPADAARRVARFLEGEERSQKRSGPGPWGGRRDFDMAMAVREAQLQGLSYEAAVQKIAEATHLSWQQVADAHARFKLAAEAEAIFRDQVRALDEKAERDKAELHPNRISGSAAE